VHRASGSVQDAAVDAGPVCCAYSSVNRGSC
jgi:hypothetical protein